MTVSGAQLIVQCLEAHGVDFVFGIPGAKIDALFDALVDSKINLVHCRHEQNAAFMAAAYGRITGKPGVVIVTSGPGVSNLATGLLTATTEGDPIVALGGNVPRSMKLKESHQSADNVRLLEAATKFSTEVMLPSNIPEILDNAFRSATAPRSGAAFISLPQDVLMETTDAKPHHQLAPVHPGAAHPDSLAAAIQLLNQAKRPVILVGQEASRPANTAAIRALVEKTQIPVTGTYQAAGVISRELVHTFFGRVGLFKNQPGDKLLDWADVILTVGYNPAEYDPEIWHSKMDKHIIHLDYNRADIHTCYCPNIEVMGDIALSVQALTTQVQAQPNALKDQAVQAFKAELDTMTSRQPFKAAPGKIHPLDFIYHLRDATDDSVRITSDIGSHYMWLSRHLLSYEPRRLLFSNGQQTLGVGLPWAMGSFFAEPKRPVISISGDGGFLFSSMALETAMRNNVSLVHFIWDDQCYNMVEEQQMMKYHRDSAVHFGHVDFVKLGESFGVNAKQMQSATEIPGILTEAKNKGGIHLIHVPIDYQDNPAMFKVSLSQVGH